MRYEIQLPDNKSIKIRRMVLAYVREEEIPPVTDADGSDVRVTWRALHTLRGASVETLHASSPEHREQSLLPVVINVSDCGAAYRFLMPLLAATHGTWILTGTPRLLQRPIEPLVSVLQEIGADIRRVGDGWLVQGKSLSASTLSIDASQSSQMASALVMAAPLLGLKTLHLTTIDIPSLSYLRMTLELTRDWQVEIPGVDVPDIPIGALGDWSAALFWFAHARLHPENEYVLSPLTLESIQGDSVIYKWFRELNVSVCCENAYSGEDEVHGRDAKFCVSTTPFVEIKASPLVGMPRLVLDVRDNLDTVPVMAALAALLPADITFQNVRNLQYKESNRLHALATQLQPYAQITHSENELRVVGNGRPLEAGTRFDTCHDHRLAMAFLLFGPNAELNDVECLKKSYSELIEIL